MADSYTDTTALANLVADGYDKVVSAPLRSQLVFRQFVDKHPVALTNVGKTVTLSIVKDIATDSTTALSETSDVDATAIPDPDQVSVTVNEYGMAEVTTLKLRQLNFAQGGVDPIIADVLVRHMARTLDSLVRAVVDDATNEIGKNSGTLATNNSSSAFDVDSVASTDKLDSDVILGAVTVLRGRNALGRDGADNFVGLIHPDVAADIMTNTGWLSPHQYTDPMNIYNAEIGAYLGTRFVQSNRCSSAANSGSVKVYNTYFLGRQALVEATIADAHVVVGPQVDRLRRFNPLGWLYHGGWNIFREECIEIAKTASSMSGLS